MRLLGLQEDPSRTRVTLSGNFRPLHFSAQGKFVAYFRVSADRQGKSGLGLHAQRKSVHEQAPRREAHAQ